jgi:hypothetical protein
MKLRSWWLWRFYPTYFNPRTGEEMRFLSRAGAQWYAIQMTILESGAEVKPPWIIFAGAEPWSFKQGSNELWLSDIFLPYWQRLQPQEREVYLQRWPPPKDYWLEYLMASWLS